MDKHGVYIDQGDQTGGKKVEPKDLRAWLMDGREIRSRTLFFCGGLLVATAIANSNFEGWLLGVRRVHGGPFTDSLATEFNRFYSVSPASSGGVIERYKLARKSGTMVHRGGEEGK